MYSLEDLSLLIREIVAEVAEVEISEVQPDTQFVQDLEMDSMMALEILAILEKKLDIQIDEEYLKRMTSMNDVLKVLEELL
jgi:acyl carrier protein